MRPRPPLILGTGQMTEHDDTMGRRPVEPVLPGDLAVLFDALRQEFDAKVSQLKAWGVAMCLAGGTIGGFVGSFTHSDLPRSAVASVSRFFGF